MSEMDVENEDKHVDFGGVEFRDLPLLPQLVVHASSDSEVEIEDVESGLNKTLPAIDFNPQPE